MMFVVSDIEDVVAVILDDIEDVVAVIFDDDADGNCQESFTTWRRRSRLCP